MNTIRTLILTLKMIIPFGLLSCADIGKPPHEQCMPDERRELSRQDSMNIGFMLSDSELTKFSNQGLEGDKDAAFKVYNYYDLAVREYGQAEKWLILSARLGHPAAKRTLQYREHSP